MASTQDNQACIFCTLLESWRPDEFLYIDDLIFAIRDIAPVAPTHVLIIPKNHNTVIGDSHSESAITRLIVSANQIASNLGIEETGYRLVINQGPNSGQQVAHLHLHLIGGRTLGSIG